MLIVPKASQVAMLEDILPSMSVLHLYTNVVTLGGDTAVGDLVEASGGGYAPIALGAWVAVAGVPSSAAHPKQTFTFTGALDNGSVRGYYVTRPDGSLVYAEKKPSPFTPENDGDTFAVTPNFSLGSLG